MSELAATASFRTALPLLAIVCSVLALGACATSKKAQKERDAGSYNMQLGMAYLNRGGLGLAKEKPGRSMAENPADPNIHSAMAMLQERLGHPDKADNEFR